MTKFFKPVLMAALISVAALSAVSPASATDNQWFHQEKGDNQHD
ncbi:MAG TPA: hypothetical protein VFY63_05400 [Pseudorhizobium sp.]|nr:hypothetical protein [Pseudorhizobium sp.]